MLARDRFTLGAESEIAAVGVGIAVVGSFGALQPFDMSIDEGVVSAFQVTIVGLRTTGGGRGSIGLVSLTHQDGVGGVVEQRFVLTAGHGVVPVIRVSHYLGGFAGALEDLQALEVRL